MTAVQANPIGTSCGCPTKAIQSPSEPEGVISTSRLTLSRNVFTPFIAGNSDRGTAFQSLPPSAPGTFFGSPCCQARPPVLKPQFTQSLPYCAPNSLASLSATSSQSVRHCGALIETSPQRRIPLSR